MGSPVLKNVIATYVVPALGDRTGIPGTLILYIYFVRVMATEAEACRSHVIAGDFPSLVQHPRVLPDFNQVCEMKRELQ